VNNSHANDTWLTPQDLQEWLQIGRTKCYEILARNDIPSYTIGRHRRIRKSDVERWLSSQKYVPGDR
jgi:excisionase family DNA binding protein